MFESLFPIIVPRSYFRLGNWPGYYRFLRHGELAVTWIELTSPNGMDYVNVERHRHIEATGFDVHATAMANLRRESRPLTTHAKTVGDRTVFQAMMHADGLGTSRLLLLPELSEVFAEGYWLGIPERSCGVVVPKSISSDEYNEMLELVSHCFRDGTTPMLPGLFEPQLFELMDH
jgi:hypothetical protein